LLKGEVDIQTIWLRNLYKNKKVVFLRVKTYEKSMKNLHY